MSQTSSRTTRKPRSATAPERTQTGFRISKQDLARIDERARAAGLSRTEFMIAASLGELPDDLNANQTLFEVLETRLEALERRLGRLEELAY